MAFLLDRIKRAFSNSALLYENFAGLQKEIGRELVEKILDKESCSRILDVGMGTGWLTHRLSLFFPEAQVVGLDFARGMIDVASQRYASFQIVQADASALPFKNEIFDLILSNLVYQWVENLEEAFKKNKACLKTDGILCMTLFGQETLQELFICLKETKGQDKEKMVSLHHLPRPEDVEALLKRSGFDSVDIVQERIQIPFVNMLELLRWLKRVGAHIHPQGLKVGRRHLLRAKLYYDEHFRHRMGIYATFAVIWVRAVKRKEGLVGTT